MRYKEDGILGRNAFRGMCFISNSLVLLCLKHAYGEMDASSEIKAGLSVGSGLRSWALTVNLL